MNVAKLFLEPLSRKTRRTLIIISVVDLFFLFWLSLPNLLGNEFRVWVSQGGLIGGTVGLYQILFSLPPVLHLAIVYALFLFPPIAFLRLYLATSRIVHKPDDKLDERQRALRNRASQISYRVICAFLLAFFALIVLIVLSGQAPPTILLYSFWSYLLLLTGAATLIVISLPTLVMAWLEPDPPAEEMPQSAYKKERAL